MKTIGFAFGCFLIPILALSAAKSGKVELFKLDSSKSILRWEGRKLGGAHQGELQLKTGEFSVKNGELKGGTVVVDMTTLKNNDQKGDMNARLVKHLTSDDFFSVEKHPTAALTFKKVEKKDGKWLVFADLTIKGITKPVTFPAEVKVQDGHFFAKGEMIVDRTNYDIRYRSLKFFADIGDKVIKDDFTINFEISATK